MNKAPAVDLLGLYHAEGEIPAAIFVVRPATDMALLENTIGRAITQRIIIERDEESPLPRPSYRIEAIEPFHYPALTASLGSSAEGPEALLYDIRANDELGITVHELGDQAPQSVMPSLE